MMVYGNVLHENTPSKLGVFVIFQEFILYLVGIFQAGLNLYP